MRARRIELGEDGQAMVEFALTFPLVLTMVTLIMQFALAFNGTALVRYAAYNAVRSASVYLPLNRGDANAAQVRQKARMAAALSMAPACPKGFGGVFGLPPGGVGRIGTVDLTERLAYAWGVMAAVPDSIVLQTRSGGTRGWEVRDPIFAEVNFYYPLTIAPADKVLFVLGGGERDAQSRAFYGMTNRRLKALRMTGKAAFTYSGFDAVER
jgi:hypothetical protein